MLLLEERVLNNLPKLTNIPLVKEICRKDESIINRPNFENHVTVFASFKHSYSDAQKFGQSLNLDDINMNLGQRQLITPGFRNKINLETEFLANMENIEVNGSRWK